MRRTIIIALTCVALGAPIAWAQAAPDCDGRLCQYLPIVDGPQPMPTAVPTAVPTAAPQPSPVPTRNPAQCSPSYPDVCIPLPPPDLDCGDIPYRRFRVIGDDPHRFDSDNDGVGCEGA